MVCIWVKVTNEGSGGLVFEEVDLSPEDLRSESTSCQVTTEHGKHLPPAHFGDG